MPYEPKADHRDNTQTKSQWTISPAEEVACFNRTVEEAWISPPHVGWGLHFDAAGIAQYLGISAVTHGEEYALFLAKFIDGNQNDTWHGYLHAAERRTHWHNHWKTTLARSCCEASALVC